ncbi:MAG: PAS domain S-box protein [Nitrospiria bacterium]
MEFKSHEKDFLLRIVEGTDDCIFVKDLESHYQFVNSATALFFNKPLEQIIGKNDFDLFPADIAAKLKADDQKVIHLGQTLQYEEVVFSPNGNPVYFLTKKAPYHDQTGKIAGVLSISRDITDRKMAEEKLRAEHAYRKPIEEAMMAGVAAVDSMGRLIYVNSAFCKMVGWAEQELLGKPPPYPYWVPEEINANLESVKSRILTGNTSEFRTQFRRKNGERFPALIKTAPLTDGHGKEIGFVATVSDITLQKSAENKLEESHHLLQSIINGTPDAIYIRDLEGRFLMINSNGARLFWKTPEEIIGKHMTELFAPKFIQKTVELDRRCLKSGNTETLEIELTIKGADYIFLTTRGPIRNHENAITGFFGISRDITDRKMAEEKLKAEYAFRMAIEEALPIGINMTDINGKLSYVNQYFCKMVGYREEELVGTFPPRPYWPPEEVENYKKMVQTRLIGEEPPKVSEVSIFPRNGERFPALLFNSPLLDGNGNKLGIVVSLIDISDRKKAEENLRQSEEKFRLLIENIKEVFFIVSPDYKQIYYMSPSYEKVWGRTVESLYKAPFSWMESIHPEDQLRLIKEMESRPPHAEYQSEFRVVRPDGTISWIRSRGFPVKDSTREVFRLVGIAEDITERRRIEEELSKVQRLESVGILGIIKSKNVGAVGFFSLC